MLKPLKNLLSLFYPQSCVACGDVLQQNEEQLCLNCMLHLPETNYHLDKANALTEIFRGRVAVENVAALFFFTKKNNVQHILHSLKYQGNQRIGEMLGEYYGKKLLQSPDFQDVDLILPVPLHEKKRKLRGYNQSACIAKGLSAGMGVPYNTTALIRAEFTETQTKKSRFNRWQNVKDVFQVVDHQALANKHLLVCDDVLTTGATLEAVIAKLLAAAENVRVSVVTLATA